MIKQFASNEFCLNHCHCCCRFSQQNSIWSPCLLNEEIGQLQKDNLSASIILQSKKISLKPYPEKNDPYLPSHVGQLYICPFLLPQDNRCKIYSTRPFECQLYPFLINQRFEKFFLSVDLGCPFIKEKINSPEFEEYINYLIEFFAHHKQIDMLKDNPQIIQTYREAQDLAELKLT